MSRAFWRNGLALTAGFLLVIILVVNIGVDDVIAAMSAAGPIYLLAGFASYALFFLLRGLRWKVLLREPAPHVSVVTTSSLSAFAWLVSTFVPMKAGDVARATMVARRERAPFATVAGTITVERLLDVLGLAAVASFGLLGAALLAHRHLDPIMADVVAIAWVLPLLAIGVLLAMAGVLRRHSSRNALLRFIGRFLDGVEQLRPDVRRLPLLIGLSLLVSAAQVSVFVCLFLALEPSAFAPLVAAGVPIFLLSFAVPLVPGHIGTYEAAFIFVFHSFGFDLDRLATMAIAIHLLTISIVTLLGSTGLVLDRLARAHVVATGQGAKAYP